ncbi:diguanylate cyclase domain-containing protein [Lysinibacillus sp. 3P01SB]|uniref:diguanylate cyclase domain-containing protein n=1 Tax=Lysinibacillus sp. 3P01SB TaxID=3132284 RepID=UPI0039A67E6A
MIYENEAYYIKKAALEHNIKKITLVSKVTSSIVIFLLLLEASFWFFKGTGGNGLPIVIWPYILLLLFNLICYYFTEIKRIAVDKENLLQMDRLIGMYVFALMSFGVLISLSDQSAYNHLMIYTLIMLVSCSFFVLNKRQILIPLGTAGAGLSFGLYIMHGNSPLYQSQMLYLIVLFPAGYFLSRSFYHSYKCSVIMQAELRNEVEMTRKLSKQLREANRKLEIQASLDPLTNVYNRRAVSNYIEYLENKAHEEPYYLSSVLLDIDHFKLYNDTYGHTNGDEVLRKIGRVLSDTAEKYNIFIARWGGEEFAMLIVDADNRVNKICEEVIKKIHHLQIEHNTSPSDRIITVSIGAHTQRVCQKKDIMSCIDHADEALYNVKNNGRNAVGYKIVNNQRLS